MMRRVQLSVALALALAGSACSFATTGMQRALDPSMERITAATMYLQTASGITGDARRIVRGDGYIYLADVGPQLRYMAMTGDSASYRILRRFAEREMVRRDSSGFALRHRYRQGAPFEKATPFGVLRFTEALALGWRTFGDTASAVLAAQMAPVAPLGGERTETDRVAEECVNAEVSLASNPAAAAAVLAKNRRYDGRHDLYAESTLGLRGSDAELVALSCLVRVGLATKDADATVRHLDKLLDRLDPILAQSGRPDPGAASDVLWALRQATAAGPKYR